MIIQCGFEYEVKSKISMTLEDLEECLTASANHYDGVCRRASREGFLNGLRNSYQLSVQDAEAEGKPIPTMVEGTLKEYDVQTLCKLLEISNHPTLYKEAMEILKQNCLESNRINQWQDKSIMRMCDRVRELSIELWTEYRKNPQVSEETVEKLKLFCEIWEKIVRCVYLGIDKGTIMNFVSLSDRLKPVMSASNKIVTLLIDAMKSQSVSLSREFASDPLDIVSLSVDFKDSYNYIMDLPSTDSESLFAIREEIACGLSHPAKEIEG